MSIIFENNRGYIISHENYVNKLYKIDNNFICINSSLFKIFSQYVSKQNYQKKSKCRRKDENVTSCNLSKEVKYVKSVYSEICKEFSSKELHAINKIKNKDAVETAEYVYNESVKTVNNALGTNMGPAIIKNIDGTNYLFPENCVFYSKDISEIKTYLNDEKFDLILLDPPWWNKYIRRKRKKCGHAYNMMFNEDLKNIPIETFIKDTGIVVVWCTNSVQNFEALCSEIFPKWQVQFVSKWFWLKVTNCGEPICYFSEPPGKQPFEQIIFGSKQPMKDIVPNGKVVVSVPSAIHSHKPPLVELLKSFLPENPKCLEIFARYLLPGWTSYGNEVLRLQHESLYEI